MSEQWLSTEIDKKLWAATRMPQPRPEFVAGLRAQLGAEPPHPAARQRLGMPFGRRGWSIALVILLALALAFLAIGPQRVAAAVRQLLGYIPGVGIVDQSAPIRVLAEPVSITRDGITLSVNSATLTTEETNLNYGVSGVPLSAYPKGEVAPGGCMEPSYLLLADGTRLSENAPIPAGVDQATFVMPCIFNTLPGTVPTDWELPLRFVAAPPDLTVMPVLDEPTPTTETTAVPSLGAQSEETPTPAQQAVTVEKVIETDDGYILIGAFRAHAPEGTWVQITGVPLIHDANGKEVDYTYPQDIQPPYSSDMKNGDFPWVYQFKAAGVAFPLTFQFSGVFIYQVDPQAKAAVAFDAGADPQPGQEWELDQAVQLAGHTVRLVSVTAGEGVYSFRIDPGPDLSGVSVEIEGHPAVGGGGGGGGPRTGEYQTSLAYTELPKGKLNILLSNPLAVSETQTWEGQWQPASPRGDWPTPSEAPNPVCLDAESFGNLAPLPAGLDGRALLTELNPQLNLVLYSLDGRQRRVLAPESSRGALSADRKQMAYPASDGIRIVDLDTGAVTTLGNNTGLDLHWSPDGRQIAFVTAGEAYGIFVLSTMDSGLRQLSNLGYESIAGWSPDGQQLYYAIPSSSNEGFLLRAVDVTTGVTQDLFVLQDSSAKAPLPEVSPDGNWIAYRGRDNGSLYIMSMDGVQNHLVIEKPSLAHAVNGIAWGPDGGLVGVSMITPDEQDGEVILMQWEACEAYRLPGVHGELDGLLIP